MKTSSNKKYIKTKSCRIFFPTKSRHCKQSNLSIYANIWRSSCPNSNTVGFFLHHFTKSEPLSPTEMRNIYYPHYRNAWRRQWHPTPVLLPGKSHGRRSLVGCSPWGLWGSDTTERLHFHFSLSCTGEGNGNPLQCSCLENPRDGGAWLAAVHGVTQSWTRLKWLSIA